MERALDIQIGGSHYQGFKIQPVEFITRNRLGFLPGCVIKRLCRYNQPGGKGLQDLQKARHEIDLLIELEGLGVPGKQAPEERPRKVLP